ncbi:MAG TPA: LCP family protein [Gaiellaceae bacterium]|nr:LCP family protein [Gaiellaceae bacterium]
MKTTLKRGYGRGAPVDGNGNGHGTLPPLATITRYRQPEQPRRSGLALLGRIMLGTLLLALMLGAGIGGGAYLYFHQSVAAVVAHTPDVKKASKQLDIPLADHAAIALVVGYDHRMGKESAGPSRSDTLMLLRADPQTKTISLLSFPRDLLVEQYCPDKTTGEPAPQGHGKINGAYALCGPSGALDTVKELTGLPINYLITVDFHGFKEIVDRVHGVWMDIDRRYYNRNVGTAATNYANINLEPGYQRLDGGDALAFVRYRHTDSDFYRLARQQEFVKALKQQISTSLGITDLPKLVTAITDNVEVGEGGGHALKGSTVLSYALFAYELPNGHFFQTRIDNTGQDAFYDVTATPEAIQQAVTEFQTPDVTAPAQATAVALGRKLKTKTPPPKQVPLYVLNGNGVAGSAANAAYELSQRGYPIMSSNAEANAPTQNYFKTEVYFRRHDAKAKAAATPLANLFAPAEIAPLPPAIAALTPPGTLVTVVVGTTFHGEIAPAPVQTAPKREPAAVRFDKDLAYESVRDRAPGLGFTAMVPTIVEQSSHLSTLDGARKYYIEGHNKALRLTFETGSSEYWGIEETAWSGAPVLAKPSQTHVFKGRTYDFYYVGSKLHMIVLRGTGGATYWVVNSLLDSLSNETMIAIAKGLQPLSR